MDRDERKKKNGVSKLDSMPITTVVGNGIVFKGDIHGDGIVRIDGRVEGSVSSKQGIILGEKADVEGRLESDNIIIFGHIKGTIKSKELILKTTGSVHGDIVSEFLEVEMGGKYDGSLKIGQHEINDDGKQDRAKGRTEQQEAERINV
jgi:cytoskeletal protein CcmA (bactofilin family)